MGSLGCASVSEPPKDASILRSGLALPGDSEDTVAAKFPHVEKPRRIHILVDDSMYTMDNGRIAFEQSWERLYGIDLEIEQYDSAGYADRITAAMEREDLPDALLMSANQYAKYAISDDLYDMTFAYKDSDLEKRINEAGGKEYIDRYRLATGNLYGLAPQNPGGYVTYIKKSWLKRVHKKVPKTYEEYLELLQAFREGDPDGNGINGDTYGVSTSDVTNPLLLPEIYQKAHSGLYQDEEGLWHDGFTEEDMRSAMGRMQYAYALGYLDPDASKNTQEEMLEKFYRDEYGILTFHAGNQAETLKENLKAAGVDDELIAIAPIAECENYQEESGMVWVIPKWSKNPDAVYHYFIETMLDGGQTQMLWTYGAEGFHWNTTREDVLGTVYSEGEFHMKENLRYPGKTYPTNLLNPWNVISPIEDDPFTSVIPESQKETLELFEKYKKPSSIIKMNRRMAIYDDDVSKVKAKLITKVSTCQMSWAAAMQEYEDSGAKEKAQMIVYSLNQAN